MSRVFGIFIVEDIYFIEVLIEGFRVMVFGEMQDKYDILGIYFFNYGQFKFGIVFYLFQFEGWWEFVFKYFCIFNFKFIYVVFKFFKIN